MQIWTEKYRPKEFGEFVGQREIVARVEAFVKHKNMPHLLFAGPAGTGKSTLSLIVARMFFGERWRENYFELNASDERGIDTVRSKVKDFARTKAIADAPFKILFLDESDALTREAQQALRRTMEMYTNTCRFILSCNFSSKIIDPIQSRCSVFRFKLLEKKDIEQIVKRISKEEKLQVSDKAMEAIYDISEGDCRRVVNILQASASVNKKIDDKLIYEIVVAAKPAEIRKILENAIDGKFLEAREKLLEVMLNQGLSGIDVIKAIQKEVWNLSVPDKVKVRLTERVGEAEFRLVEGSDEFIQLEALLASFAIVGKELGND